MLDSTGDTASEVDFWLNSCTSLTYLVGVIDPTSVNSCSGGTYNTANLVSELLDEFESGSIAQSSSAGADDFCISQGNQFLSGLNDFYDLSSDVGFGDFRVNLNDFAGCAFNSFSLLHNARSYC